jgi:hypothetical protein
MLKQARMLWLRVRYALKVVATISKEHLPPDVTATVHIAPDPYADVAAI